MADPYRMTFIITPESFGLNDGDKFGPNAADSLVGQTTQVVPPMGGAKVPANIIEAELIDDEHIQILIELPTVPSVLTFPVSDSIGESDA